MGKDLLIGTALISTSVGLHTLGLILVTRMLSLLVGALGLHGQAGRVLAMTAVVLCLFAILSAEIWMWALCYVLLGVVPDFATALYFSTTTFATVGYGDVTPRPDWRLLAALEGVTGFLLIGWSTAYLVSAGMRVGPFRSGEHF